MQISINKDATKEKEKEKENATHVNFFTCGIRGPTQATLVRKKRKFIIFYFFLKFIIHIE